MSDKSEFTGISLNRDFVVIVGPPDSGKSNLAKWLLSQPEYARHLVYDPLYGFDSQDYNVVRPPTQDYKYRRYEEGNEELNIAVDKFILDTQPSMRPAYFVIDEAARLLPNGKPEGPAMGNLNDFNAHIDLGNGQGLSVWLLCQRLAQLNTDMENKTNHFFFMGYSGKNDKRAIEDIDPKIIELLQTTSKYGFVYAGPNGVRQKFEPVDKMGEKSKI